MPERSANAAEFSSLAKCSVSKRPIWLVETASTDGVWVDYKWEDPSTGEIEAKSSWVVLHDGNIFGAGIYKP